MQISLKKRRLATYLSLVLMLGLMACSLIACGGKKTPTSEQKTETTGQVQAVEQTTAADEENTTNPKPGSEGILKVGMECDYPPYNWTQADASNGAIQIEGSQEYAYGYDVMMAKLIGEATGKTVEIHRLPWDNLSKSLQAGTIDVVIAGQSITAAQRAKADFSQPYFFAKIVAVTKKGSPYAQAKSLSDLKGASVTSQLGTVWYDLCCTQISEGNVLQPLESTPEIFEALASNQANVVICDRPTALGAVKSNPDLVMLDFNETEDNFRVTPESINIGISVKRGNYKLLRKIDDLLTKYKPEDYDRMMNEAIEAEISLHKTPTAASSNPSQP